jgi:hypothetical protein
VGAVTDIGWHRDTALIPDPLISGTPNGTLFTYIRRFNKDVFDVRSVPMEVTSGLDLNEAWAPDYATEKIPLHLQRLYLTVVMGIASLLRQVARLRSWRETNRTAAFCGVRTTVPSRNLFSLFVVLTHVLRSTLSLGSSTSSCP